MIGKIYILFVSILFLISCDGFLESDDPSNPYTPSTDEVVSALKTALTIGTDSAVSKLNVDGGYFNNLDVRVPLPPEVDKIVSNLNEIKSNPTLSNAVGELLFASIDDKLDDLLLSVNRAAEFAAKEGGTIFVSAIKDMSISEGWDILNGIVPGSTKSVSDFDSTAATNFLALRTFDNLTVTFATPMDNALDEKFVGNFSANEIWNSTTESYNNIVGIVGGIPTYLGGKQYETVNTNLSQFVVGKALDGFFLRIGQEEKKIRKNPFDWAVQIIQDVFGYIKDQFEKNK